MKCRVVLVFGWALVSCDVSPPVDLVPPVLRGQHLSSSSTFEVEWDDVARATAEFNGESVRPRVTSGAVEIAWSDRLGPGASYPWSVAVEDHAGNSTSVRGRFRGPNDHPAQLNFHEVRFAGTGERGDAVEFEVAGAGNLGGIQLSLTERVGGGRRWVFPDLEVAKGELFVVRFHPSARVAGTVLDFPGGKGLSGTVGLLVLQVAETASPSQWFLWAKRPGEGLALARKEGLSVAETEEHPTEGCTPTRSWSRRPDGSWFITATGGATLGAPNSTKPWDPRPSTPKPDQGSSSIAPPRDPPLRPSRPSARAANTTGVEAPTPTPGPDPATAQRGEAAPPSRFPRGSRGRGPHDRGPTPPQSGDPEVGLREQERGGPDESGTQSDPFEPPRTPEDLGPWYRHRVATRPTIVVSTSTSPW